MKEDARDGAGGCRRPVRGGAGGGAADRRLRHRLRRREPGDRVYELEQQIEAGRSDEEIIEYFTDRDGEWVLMDPPVRGNMLAQPLQAMQAVDGALAQDPQHVEAPWFQANIALYGLSDPATAMTVLEQLQQRTDLEPEVRSQVDALLGEALQRTAGR